ncbi:MAG: hypothetical protein R3B70_14770 [Polyangiaceae bacterium]
MVSLLERRALQPHCAAGELDGQRVIAAISSQGTLIDAVLRPRSISASR